MPFTTVYPDAVIDNSSEVTAIGGGSFPVGLASLQDGDTNTGILFAEMNQWIQMSFGDPSLTGEATSIFLNVTYNFNGKTRITTDGSLNNGDSFSNIDVTTNSGGSGTLEISLGTSTDVSTYDEFQVKFTVTSGDSTISEVNLIIETPDAGTVILQEGYIEINSGKVSI
tara:strand:- start:4008 stop:4514 length:507 start_codon:yes stop_codon:yes gene_type:complete